MSGVVQSVSHSLSWAPPRDLAEQPRCILRRLRHADHACDTRVLKRGGSRKHRLTIDGILVAGAWPFPAGLQVPISPEVFPPGESDIFVPQGGGFWSGIHGTPWLDSRPESAEMCVGDVQHTRVVVWKMEEALLQLLDDVRSRISLVLPARARPSIVRHSRYVPAVHPGRESVSAVPTSVRSQISTLHAVVLAPPARAGAGGCAGGCV
jgi:hypothetical protein